MQLDKFCQNIITNSDFKAKPVRKKSKMTFQQIIELAIEAYAELSGMSVHEVALACRDFDSQTAKNVRLLIAASK